MIDALVILFSSGMCLFIAFRALQLDAKLPWFGAEAPPVADPEGHARPAEVPGWRARRQTGR